MLTQSVRIASFNLESLDTPEVGLTHSTSVEEIFRLSPPTPIRRIPGNDCTTGRLLI